MFRNFLLATITFSELHDQHVENKDWKLFTGCSDHDKMTGPCYDVSTHLHYKGKDNYQQSNQYSICYALVMMYQQLYLKFGSIFTGKPNTKKEHFCMYHVTTCVIHLKTEGI